MEHEVLHGYVGANGFAAPDSDDEDDWKLRILRPFAGRASAFWGSWFSEAVVPCHSSTIICWMIGCFE